MPARGAGWPRKRPGNHPDREYLLKEQAQPIRAAHRAHSQHAVDSGGPGGAGLPVLRARGPAVLRPAPSRSPGPRPDRQVLPPPAAAGAAPGQEQNGPTRAPQGARRIP